MSEPLNFDPAEYVAAWRRCGCAVRVEYSPEPVIWVQPGANFEYTEEPSDKRIAAAMKADPDAAAKVAAFLKVEAAALPS